MEWINEAGQTLGFTVKSEKRHITHGKIFQIDSMWFNGKKLFAFVEAERRWETNHIIGHLTCCIDYALQEKVQPFFVLVFLENESDHCNRLHHTWKWLTRLLPPVLKIKCLPIYIKRDENRTGLHSSTLTKHKFTQKIQEMIKYDIE